MRNKRSRIEQETLNTIVAVAEARGCVVTRVFTGSLRLPNGKGGFWQVKGAKTGTSDLILCVPPSGRFLAVEVKEPDGRPSDEQLDFIERVANAKGFGAVVFSVSQFEAILDTLRCPKIGG